MILQNYSFDGRQITVKIRAYICDAPARADIVETKYFNAYYGCNKCEQKGIHIDRRMTFPFTNSSLRTDASFRNRTNSPHHVKDHVKITTWRTSNRYESNSTGYFTHYESWNYEFFLYMWKKGEKRWKKQKCLCVATISDCWQRV